MDARSSFFLKASPLAQVAMYDELKFGLANKQQREGVGVGVGQGQGQGVGQGQGGGEDEGEGEGGIPSLGTFLSACLAASRLPPGQCSLTREVSDEARAEAIATASPLMCAAMQDLPGGRGGRGG